jgi:hypothetical protein
MKGAIALPCDKTMSPPNSSIAIIMGSNQNFLRDRMKAQSSIKNAMVSR